MLGKEGSHNPLSKPFSMFPPAGTILDHHRYLSLYGICGKYFFLQFLVKFIYRVSSGVKEPASEVRQMSIF